jgi:hypothetical protein
MYNISLMVPTDAPEKSKRQMRSLLWMVQQEAKLYHSVTTVERCTIRARITDWLRWKAEAQS